MLKLEFCRERQARLLRVMEDEKLEVAILGNPKTIHYFTGALVDAALPQAFVISASGRSLLVTSSEPSQCLADRVQTYTAYTINRLLSRASMHAELAAMASAAAAR
ncbi:MAG: aminopeptidase P family N-terminal domain-containing protein, partial [Bryobacteraceae bacterium]